MSKKTKIIPMNPLVSADPISVVALQKEHYLTQEKDASGLAGDLYLVDQDKKISVYKHSHSVIDALLFGSLTQKGRDLYLYIMYHLPEDRDYITLRLADVRANTGISRNSIVSALQDLRALNIIQSKSQSEYWVNPHYFFCGNRIKYYKENNPEAIIVKSVVRRKDRKEEVKSEHSTLSKLTPEELNGWSKWTENNK